MATWIPSLWLLYSASKQLGTWLNITTTIEAGSLPDRYFLLTLGALGTLVLLRRHFSWSGALKKNNLLILVVSYMLLSAIWSRVPGISLRRWGREAIAVIMASLLASEQFPIKAFFSTLRRAIYIALPYSLLLIKYFPLYGRQYNRWTGELTWVGVASQKNGLALLCAFSAVFLIWSLWESLLKWNLLVSKLPVLINILMLSLSLFLMMGPGRTFKYSATSFLSLLTGLIILIFLRIAVIKGIGIKGIIISVAIAVIFIGTFMPFSGKVPIKEIPMMLGRDPTLTGRIQIWNALVPYAIKKIILGHGFGGFWTTSLREQIASHAHNGYLDTILDLGFTGLILFSIFLISITVKCIKSINIKPDFSLLCLSIIIMFLIHNVGEVSLGNISSFPCSLIVLFSFLIHDKKNEIKINSRGIDS